MIDTINSKALKYLNSNFTDSEVDCITKMFDMTYNTDSAPYTKATLNEELHYTLSKFDKFLAKLVKKSIIYYVKGMIDDKDQTWIMLNPFLARKSKIIYEEYIIIFEDIRNSKLLTK